MYHTAWWDPDEMCIREEDALLTDAQRKARSDNLMRFLFTPLAVMWGGLRGSPRGRRPQPMPTPPVRPNPSCRSCRGSCPLDRHFDLVDATPYKKVWRCSRCGETFRTMSSDNPANYHSC